MSDHTPTLHDDVAYLRDLAHQGANAPLAGGSMLMLAGLIFGGASLISWAMARQFLPVPTVWGNYVWIPALLVFFIAFSLVKARMIASAGVFTTNNRAVGAVWAGVGWSIMAFLFAVMAACWRLHMAAPSAMITPFILAVYGIGWLVSAAMSPAKWVYAMAWGSFIAAIIMGFLADSPDLLLAYTVALVLLAALPGFILMRQASRV
ncbi:MAG: hypothetical protein AB1429_17200 [Pseudomonadota bacterium]|jgi:hypothetical protein